MDISTTEKKHWAKPSIHSLSITKDTFGGSQPAAEGLSNGTATVPKDPTPR